MLNDNEFYAENYFKNREDELQMKIIYGSSNQAKVAEITTFFAINNIDVEVLTLKDINFNQEIEENGTTFEENSLIKAQAIKEFCNARGINEIIVTDDAGLCVDALNGRPGVYSARYAGDHAPQEVTVNKLLTEMQGIPEDQRTAKFCCVLTAILPDNNIIVCKGETLGKIATKIGPLGKLTFGPVFMPDGMNGRVMNELGPDELKRTHREKALIELLTKLDLNEKRNATPHR